MLKSHSFFTSVLLAGAPAGWGSGTAKKYDGGSASLLYVSGVGIVMGARGRSAAESERLTPLAPKP
jgi:hypothetical protein